MGSFSALAGHVRDRLWKLRDSEADTLIMGWVSRHLGDLASVVFGLSLVLALGDQNTLSNGLSTKLFNAAVLNKFWPSLFWRIAFVLVSWLMFYRTLAIVRRAGALFVVVMMAALIFDLLAELCLFSTPVISFSVSPATPGAYLLACTSAFLAAYFALLVIGCILQASSVRSYAVGYGLYLLGIALFMACSARAATTFSADWIWFGVMLCVLGFVAGRTHATVNRERQDAEVRDLMRS